MSMKQIYRRIWAWFLAGALLFFAILALGGRIEGRSSLDMHSTSAWLLVIPVGCIVYAAYTSMRYWHCEYCGSALPTKLAKKCTKCGREIDYK
jgi:thiosulfate reductase cytochrome b subunit